MSNFYSTCARWLWWCFLYCRVKIWIKYSDQVQKIHKWIYRNWHISPPYWFQVFHYHFTALKSVIHEFLWRTYVFLIFSMKKPCSIFLKKLVISDFTCFFFLFTGVETMGIVSTPQELTPLKISIGVRQFCWESWETCRIVLLCTQHTQWEGPCSLV